MRPGDAVIALAGAAAVAALALNIHTGETVRTLRVTQAGHAHADYPAWRDRQIVVNGPLGETVIEIRDGRARVLRSPCTRKICLRAGWLDAAGDAAACVPNRVSIALLGDDARFDAINF